MTSESRPVAAVTWTRGDAPFLGGRYPRSHAWIFDGGARVAASASPHVVRPPYADPAAVDPEEAFVAALASCHMLWFLSFAAADGLLVDSYADEAEGLLEAEGDGARITSVTLRPVVTTAVPVDPARMAALHGKAHHACFLARSVNFPVRCEPRAASITAQPAVEGGPA